MFVLLLLLLGPVVGGVVAVGVWSGLPSKPPTGWWPGWLWIGDQTHAWTRDQRLAGVGAVAAIGALYEAVVVGIIALVAYAFASERPRLKIELRQPLSKADLVTLVYDDSEPDHNREVVQVDGLLLLRVRLYNRSQFSARNPAVRLQLIGFEGQTQVTGYWQKIDTIRPGATHAWLRNGGVDDTIHGPKWFWDLDVLDLRSPQGGQVLSRKQGITQAIYIEAVAEGDSTARKYVIDWKTPTQWVNGDRERDQLLPAELQHPPPADAPEEAAPAQC